MKAATLVCQVRLAAFRNGCLRDGRARAGWLVAGLFGLALAVFLASRLAPAIGDWQAQGSLEMPLWLVCLGTWASIAGLGALSFLRKGFADDEASLLHTMPIPPAGLIRAMFGVAVLDLLAWLLVTTGSVAFSLASSLGWPGLGWAALLSVGSIAAVWIALLLVVSTLRYLVPNLGKAVVGVLVAGAALLALCYSQMPEGFPENTSPGHLSLPAPGLLAVLIGLVVVVGLGPLAGPIGRAYVVAYHLTQGRATRQIAITRPIAWFVESVFLHRRTLTGALMYKGTLGRIRHWLNWARLVVLIGALAAFPWVRDLVEPYGVPDRLLVVGFVCGLVVYAVLDGATSPIGGEANRLTLLLTAPLSMIDILRAKLIAFLAPVLAPSLGATVLLCFWLDLEALDILVAVLSVALIILGVAALVVWGSAWDEDLDLAIESGLMGLLQEEAPMTPRRMLLVGLAALLLAFGLFVYWRLPEPHSLVALVTVDLAALFVTGWSAKWCLGRLLSRR